MGYEKPSPIQLETIPILLRGPTDFLGLAATGTGKTAAFALPLLNNTQLHEYVFAFTSIISHTTMKFEFNSAPNNLVR